MVVAVGVLFVARLAASGFSDILPGLDQRFRAAVPVLTAMVAMIYLLSIAMHYVVIEAQASRRSELLAREAQLRALKAQVNPHFLFNSLNFHQRADGERRGERPGDVYPAGGLSAHLAPAG
jgi:two-component system sensor histidine kinase AlgZ